MRFWCCPGCFSTILLSPLLLYLPCLPYLPLLLLYINHTAHCTGEKILHKLLSELKQPFRSPMEGLRKVKTKPKLSSSSHYSFKMMYEKRFMYDPERSPPFSKNRPLADSFIKSQCPSVSLSVCVFVPFHKIFF